MDINTIALLVIAASLLALVVGTLFLYAQVSKSLHSIEHNWCLLAQNLSDKPLGRVFSHTRT